MAGGGGGGGGRGVCVANQSLQAVLPKRVMKTRESGST